MPGPACSIASQVKRYRMVLYPSFRSLLKWTCESSSEKGRPTKDTLSASKNLLGSYEGTSGVFGYLASPATLMPRRTISRFWGSRKDLPSMWRRREPILAAVSRVSEPPLGDRKLGRRGFRKTGNRGVATSRNRALSVSSVVTTACINSACQSMKLWRY